MPRDYEQGQVLDIYVSQLESPRTTLPFDWYSLNWCNNTKGNGFDKTQKALSLTGTPLVESPYSYKFNTDKNWNACHKVLTHAEVQQFSFFMQHNYTYSLVLDGLPSAVILRDFHDRELPTNYFKGIPVGEFSRVSIGNHQMMIYNHLDITVMKHTTPDGRQRIVGFEVEPFSIGEGPKRG